LLPYSYPFCYFMPPSRGLRVNHFITLLKFAPEVIKTVKKMGNPMPKRYVIERRLRSIVKLPSKKQRAIIIVDSSKFCTPITP